MDAKEKSRLEAVNRRNAISELLNGDEELAIRLKSVRNFAATVRVSEYHLTNACNIRCQGCWFFEYGHDQKTKEVKSIADLEAFIEGEKARRVTTALLIGGEPTLVQDRVRAFVRGLKYVTISSNGLKKLPYTEEFANVAVLLTLFGGGKLDDELRATKPGGKRFAGLFDKALENYRDDDRACFIYALTERGLDYIEDTVRRIAENGNKVTFNFYSEYNTDSPIKLQYETRLLEEALRVKALYPETVISHPTHIRGIITGQTHWGTFGYHSCPSVSVHHPAHKDRLANGNPTLPFFNTYNADFKTVEFCCTSGHCEGCRDSQAVYSWLMVNMDRHLTSKESLREWVDIAECYWAQFKWSPYHHARRAPAVAVAAAKQVRFADGLRAAREHTDSMIPAA
ncbi:MAG TPA: radical SAM protein [Stellaceae bacterium]